MKSMRKPRLSILAAPVAVFIAMLTIATLGHAQAPAHFLGTITAITGNTITVKSDLGQAVQVMVPTTAILKRIAPGQKDLTTAETIQFGDLAVGDRALVKIDPASPTGTSQALQIVAIKQADVALKQQKDREDWQQRGTGGLVKSVNAAVGIVVLTTGSGTTAKTITVHITKATALKRYAPASVRFDEALPAPIDTIHAGDQVRARGAKSADGAEIFAEEIVSGSFRNISGTIASLDTATSTLVVKDLATKKPVTIHITGEVQMRRLPDRMAQMLAGRLKGVSNAAAAQSTHGADPMQRGTGQAPDPQQMLNRAPAIQLIDLQKGEAVMAVSTDGTADVTAITLVAGVEPLLEAPTASRDLLANWSMNTGAPDTVQ